MLAGTEVLPPAGLTISVGAWRGLLRPWGLDPEPKVCCRVVRDGLATAEECATARRAIEAATALFPAIGPGERSLAPVSNHLSTVAVAPEMEELLGGPKVSRQYLQVWHRKI